MTRKWFVNSSRVRMARVNRAFATRTGSGMLGWRRLYVQPLMGATRLVAGFLRGAFSQADLRWKHTASGMPKNYVVRARRPN